MARKQHKITTPADIIAGTDYRFHREAGIVSSRFTLRRADHNGSIYVIVNGCTGLEAWPLTDRQVQNRIDRCELVDATCNGGAWCTKEDQEVAA